MILSYVKKFKGKLTTSDALAHAIVSVPIPDETWATIISRISAVQDDNTDRGTYEDVSGFYRVGTGNVTQEGSTANQYSIESAAGLTITHTANVANKTVDIEVTGIGTDNYHWEAEVEVRYHENAIYAGPPRMEITISGMAAAGKLDWNGLTDGVNQVLDPTSYSLVNAPGTGVYSYFEAWNLYTGTLAPPSGEGLMLRALIEPVPTPTNRFSSIRFAWDTFTGASGTGTPIIYTKSSYFTPTPYAFPPFNGMLRDRVLANSAIFVTGGGPVTFMWHRKEGDSWGNYAY